MIDIYFILGTLQNKDKISNRWPRLREYEKTMYFQN